MSSVPCGSAPGAPRGNGSPTSASTPCSGGSSPSTRRTAGGPAARVCGLNPRTRRTTSVTQIQGWDRTVAWLARNPDRNRRAAPDGLSASPMTTSPATKRRPERPASRSATTWPTDWPQRKDYPSPTPRRSLPQLCRWSSPRRNDTRPLKSNDGRSPDPTPSSDRRNNPRSHMRSPRGGVRLPMMAHATATRLHSHAAPQDVNRAASVDTLAMTSPPSAGGAA